jgi:hypothetical protein
VPCKVSGTIESNWIASLKHWRLPRENVAGMQRFQGSEATGSVGVAQNYMGVPYPFEPPPCVGKWENTGLVPTMIVDPVTDCETVSWFF